MSSFTSDLNVTYLRKKNLWRIERDFRYYAGFENSSEFYDVPKGFLTDFATIPRPLWPIVGHPAGGPYVQAAALHDWLLTNRGSRRKPIMGLRRKKADQLFLEAMTVLEVPTWQRMLMYAGVRFYAMVKGVS